MTPAKRRSSAASRKLRKSAAAVPTAPVSNPDLCGPLLAEIAREMQTPLSNISLGAQTLEKLLELNGGLTESTPNLNRILSIFQRACQQQRHLIDTLMALAQTESDHTVSTEAVDLTTWLSPTLAAEAERARLWQQEVSVAIAPDLELLETNGTILARILSELLADVACQTPPGGTIAIVVDATLESVRFTLQGKERDAETTTNAETADIIQSMQERERPERNGAGLSLAHKLSTLLGGALLAGDVITGADYCLLVPQDPNVPVTNEPG